MDSAKDQLVRNEILSQAQELFRQYGLKKTTMDEIAAACGKAKSTLYYYYKSKEQVFDAVLNKELTDLRKLVRAKVEEHKTVIDKMRAYVMEFHKQIVDRANLYRVVQYEQLSQVIERKHYLNLMEFEQAYVSRILEDGIDAGELSFIKKSDVEWVSEFFCSAFFGIVRHSIEKDGFFDEKKIAKAIELFIPRIFS